MLYERESRAITSIRKNLIRKKKNETDSFINVGMLAHDTKVCDLKEHLCEVLGIFRKIIHCFGKASIKTLSFLISDLTITTRVEVSLISYKDHI